MNCRGKINLEWQTWQTSGLIFLINHKNAPLQDGKRSTGFYFSLHNFLTHLVQFFFLSHTLRCGTIQWSMADLLGVIPLKKVDSPLSCHLLIPFHLALGFCVQLLLTMLGYLYNLNVYRSCAYCHNFTEIFQLLFWVLDTVSLYIDAQFRIWSLSFCLLHIEQLWISVLIAIHCKRSFSDDCWQMH